MIYLGKLHYNLGIEVFQDPVSTQIEKKLKLILKEGNEFEDATKYRWMIGSLIDLTTTGPTILFVVGMLSRFMRKPCEGHWFVAKRVLKYLKGTKCFGLKYSKVDEFSLTGYFDSGFNGDKETRLSTSCYSMSLGSTIVA